MIGLIGRTLHAGGNMRRILCILFAVVASSCFSVGGLTDEAKNKMLMILKRLKHFSS